MNCSNKKKEVLFLSEIDWDYLWQRHQIFASLYAAKGHRVTYVNRPGMRLPKITDIPYILKRLIKKTQKIDNNPMLNVVSPIFFPGNSKFAKRMNKWFFVPKLLKNIGGRNHLILHVYQPTELTREIIKLCPNADVVYDCVQNFEKHPARTALTVKIENELIQKSQIVVTDSDFLFNKHHSKKKEVVQVPPGVDFEMFNRTGRGDEEQKLREILYYGHVRADLDIELINNLAENENFNVTILGKISPGLPIPISERVTIIGQQPYVQLPEFIREADMLLLPYTVNEFTSAIIPAKFYECLASMKPILATNMPSLSSYSDYIVNVGQLEKLSPSEIQSVLKKQNKEARKMEAEKCSWQSRFEGFYNLI